MAPLCTGYEVVCPDGRVRDYPYHNLGDAESTARLATKRQCRLYPEPSPLELSQPPCPEGEHVVRVVGFQEPELADEVASALRPLLTPLARDAADTAYDQATARFSADKERLADELVETARPKVQQLAGRSRSRRESW